MSDHYLPHSEQECVGSGATFRVLCADCGAPFPCQTYQVARAEWHARWQKRKRVAVEGILLDLISDLRDMACDGIDSGWAPLLPVADTYEARLREVRGG